MSGGPQRRRGWRDGTARRIGDIVSERDRPRNALERLVRKSNSRASLDAQLRAVLPAPLAIHCRVGLLEGRLLLVHVDSASWATRLRLALPQAQPALRALADFAAVEEVRIRSKPPGEGLSKAFPGAGHGCPAKIDGASR